MTSRAGVASFAVEGIVPKRANATRRVPGLNDISDECAGPVASGSVSCFAKESNAPKRAQATRRVLGLNDSSDERVRSVASDPRRSGAAPKVAGLNESSEDDDKKRPKSARLRLNKAAAEARDAEEALVFQPKEVNPVKCTTLEWNGGRGQLQCSNAPRKGSDVCGRHSGLPHGRARGAIPAEKIALSRAYAMKPVKDSKQYYAQHLMWAYAIVMCPGLRYVNEVGADGEYLLTDLLYERCLKKIQEHATMNALQAKYKRGAGVRFRDDRLGGNRYGAERERYNGVCGGACVQVVYSGCLQPIPGTYGCD